MQTSVTLLTAAAYERKAQDVSRWLYRPPGTLEAFISRQEATRDRSGDFCC